MKNFPHQFNDLGKLTGALNVLSVLQGAKQSVADDGVFGEGLANAGIYTFRGIGSVANRLAAEKLKPTGNQGFRTAAREMRRFFAVANLINGQYLLTPRGKAIVDSGGNIALRNALWREAMLQMALTGSHPYRILLRLVADHPTGLEINKLLLAFEATDDSEAEYARILALSKLPFTKIVANLGIGEANAANAVKILPAIAEQVGDIRRHGGRAYLHNQALTTEDDILDVVDTKTYEKTDPTNPVEVDPDNISPVPNFGATPPSPVDLAAAIELRKKRTIEHHTAVISIAKLLASDGFKTYERPFDCLGVRNGLGSLLIEVKTLDGTRSDERKQSEKALGQIKGYAYYNVPAAMKAPKLIEIVAYGDVPSKPTIDFMRANSIRSVWLEDDHWLTADDTGNTVNLSPGLLLS
ncbi:hypothetical protein [Agrobacterium pusense]